jgi:hypothetical protein
MCSELDTATEGQTLPAKRAQGRALFGTLGECVQGGAKVMIRSYQGKTPVVPESCYVDLSAQVNGDVELGEHSSVWMNAVLRGDVNSIRWANSNVQDCAVLHGQRYLYSVTVGDWVTIGHNATVHGCVVEDAVLIGMGVSAQQCAHRRGIDHRRRSRGAGGNRCAAANALGRRSGKDAPRTGRRRPGADPHLRRELSGLHGDLFTGNGTLSRGGFENACTKKRLPEAALFSKFRVPGIL